MCLIELHENNGVSMVWGAMLNGVTKSALISFALFIFIYLGLLAVVLIYFKSEKSRAESIRKRTPFTKPLSRPAGESTRLKIDEIQSRFDEMLSQVLVLLTMAAFVPLLALNLPVKIIIFAMCLSVIFVQIRKFRSFKNDLDNYRIGFEGERYVAQTLNLLMRDGEYVFHDLPFDIEGRKFNIDHIIVGASGVFAIETKAKRKPEGTSTVHFNGTELKFSDDTRAPRDIKQVRGNARDLANCLNERLSNKIFVQPVLLYPGWYVTSDNDEQIVIRNHERFVSEFGNFRASESEFSETEINQIRARLAELVEMPILERMAL